MKHWEAHDKALVTEIGSAIGLSVKQSVAAASLTTFAIGGACRALVEPQSVEQIIYLLQRLNHAGIPWSVIGAGSNVLIDDAGLDRWLIRLGREFRFLRELNVTDAGVRCEVGGTYSLMSLSRELSERGYAGLEFAGGIPASFGGAVRMNAGAHGHEISEVLEEVRVVNGLGALRVCGAKELEFSYRHSSIPYDSIVVSGTITLQRGDPRTISEERKRCLEERKSRQPLTLPSAGSVFKNPSLEQSAGWLIEQCALKGRAIGGAIISPKHANWIVNQDRSASASDVRALIQICQEEVQRKFGIELVSEVIYWGNSSG